MFIVQWESLYVEALYTIKHRIGRNVDTDLTNDRELYDYVQTAFGISASEHARLMAKACKEKVSQFTGKHFSTTSDDNAVAYDAARQCH
jgi:hypothetical protein